MCAPDIPPADRPWRQQRGLDEMQFKASSPPTTPLAAAAAAAAAPPSPPSPPLLPPYQCRRSAGAGTSATWCFRGRCGARISPCCVQTSPCLTSTSSRMQVGRQGGWEWWPQQPAARVPACLHKGRVQSACGRAWHRHAPAPTLAPARDAGQLHVPRKSLSFPADVTTYAGEAAFSFPLTTFWGSADRRVREHHVQASADTLCVRTPVDSKAYGKMVGIRFPDERTWVARIARQYHDMCRSMKESAWRRYACRGGGVSRAVPLPVSGSRATTCGRWTRAPRLPGLAKLWRG
jgi:hypothetical protein